MCPSRRSRSGQGYTVTEPSAAGAAVTGAPVGRQTVNEITHWRLAAEALADLDDLAPAAAWAGLEAYLRLQVRDRLTGVVSAVVREAAGLRAAGRIRRARERPACRAARPASPLPAGGDRPRLLHRRRGRAHQLGPGRPAPRPGHARGATRWPPRWPRWGSRRRPPWSTSTRVSVRRSCGPASGSGTAPIRRRRRRSSSPGTTCATRRRCCTRPATRWVHLTGWNAELAAGLNDLLSARSPEAAEAWRSWAGEIAADVHAFAQSGWAPAYALANVVDGTAAEVFRLPLGDPHPFAWIRVAFNVALCRSWFGDGSVGRRRRRLGRPARPGRRRPAGWSTWPGSAWRRCRTSCSCAPARRCAPCAVPPCATCWIRGGCHPASLRSAGAAGRRVAAHVVLPAPAAATDRARPARHPRRRSDPDRAAQAPRAAAVVGRDVGADAGRPVLPATRPPERPLRPQGVHHGTTQHGDARGHWSD